MPGGSFGPGERCVRFSALAARHCLIRNNQPRPTRCVIERIHDGNDLRPCAVTTGARLPRDIEMLVCIRQFDRAGIAAQRDNAYGGGRNWFRHRHMCRALRTFRRARHSALFTTWCLPTFPIARLTPTPVLPFMSCAPSEHLARCRHFAWLIAAGVSAGRLFHVDPPVIISGALTVSLACSAMVSMSVLPDCGSIMCAANGAYPGR